MTFQHTSTIAGLESALADIDRQMRELEKKRSAIVETLQYLSSLDASVTLVAMSTEPGPMLSSVGRIAERSPKSVPDAIFEMLTAEEPMHRTEIHDRLVKKGFHIGGKNPINNIAGHLSRDSRFVSRGGGRWGLGTPSSNETRRPTVRVSELRDSIFQMLRTEQPLHRMEIHDRLVEKGFHIGGQKPVNTVGAHLSLDRRFKSLGNGNWALVGSDMGPGDHDGALPGFGDQYENEDDEDAPW